MQARRSQCVNRMQLVTPLCAGRGLDSRKAPAEIERQRLRNLLRDQLPAVQKDGRNSADSCKDDTGCVRIAEHILRGQMNRYRTALERYARTRSAGDLAQFRSIERDLLTPYYAALTLHSIDLRDVCNGLRQKAGLPELEEMQ